MRLRFFYARGLRTNRASLFLQPGYHRIELLVIEVITCMRGNMKDVKVDVRVDVNVDAASVVLLLASAAMALFMFKQNKQQKLTSNP
jgi:hypothetical protein